VSKGSQKKRPVDPDLQDRMKQAIDPEYEVPQRKPWFDQDREPSSQLTEGIRVAPDREEWMRGSVSFKDSVVEDGDVLCVSRHIGNILPLAPLVVDGCYVIRVQYGDSPTRYVYVRCELADSVTIESEH